MRITSITVLLTAMAWASANSNIWAEDPPKLAPVLQPFVDNHVLAGAVVLVADPSKTLDLEAVGWMDIAAKKPMRTDSMFWIASQSKPLTCTALMILADEGKINIDDPVEKYLPEFKGLLFIAEQDDSHQVLKKPSQLMRVRDVMCHVSGLPGITPVMWPTLDALPLATTVRANTLQPLLAEPGKKYTYSNPGINTVGRLIEVASGMPYERFMDERLFQPLGMKDTTFWPNDEQLSRLAKSYKPNAGKSDLEETPIASLRYPLNDRSRYPFPGGGLFSTAVDLSHFYRMIANNGLFGEKRILSESAVAQMTTDQTGDLKNSYGFGFGTNGKIVSHGGAYNTHSRFDREHQLITVFLVQHAGWVDAGKQIQPAFWKAATEGYSSKPAETVTLTNPPATPAAPSVVRENVVLFNEPGRYGGWPANHGLWQWGDELVAGFQVATYKPSTGGHAVDFEKPFENWQARSLDGGKTWKSENDLPFVKVGGEPTPKPLTEPIDFTDPNFALMFRLAGLHLGPSWFYTTRDRCRTWQGPYSFAVDGIDKICTRTDLIVLGKHDCLMFGSAAKSDDKEGRVFCARTTDGGRNWKLVSLIGPEPAEYAIMPSTVRLPSGALITTIRNAKPGYNITTWRSDDLGEHWKLLSEATGNIGGNPPSLVILKDGRLCLTYGFRKKPFGVRARTSNDEGQTWGPEIVLRDDGLTGDLGYPRSVVRPDGKVFTIYYFNGPKDDDRTIQGTFWEPPKSVDVAAKLELPAKVDRVRFLPAPKREQALVGGKISGSNVSPHSGFQVLGQIKEAPSAGQWSEITLTDTKPYRWVRYEAPPGSRGNVAELEFYSGPHRLRGGGFGTPGSSPPGGHWKTALDGKNETWFNSNNPDGQYIGVDLGDLASTARAIITPGGGNWDQPQTVSMKSSTPGAIIRYTLDGTTPGAQEGQIYEKPFPIEANTTLVAVASSDGLAPSTPTISTIGIGKPKRPPANSFHIGNSLTGNASRYSSFIRTTGEIDDFPAYLIGGSLTVKLWNESQGPDKGRWDTTYAKAVHPLDYFTIQPRDFNVAQEVDHAVRFIKLIREKSPDVQTWLYAEWVEMNRNRPTDKGEVPSSQMTKTFPALTWEESMGAMLLYNEEVQHQITAKYPEGKRVRVIPTAIAFGWARNLIDNGKFPGVSPGEASFYETLFDDQVHVNANGCYLVALTWYAALHGESPEGKILPIGTTLTSEQARLLQRLAWQLVKNYPDCGVYAVGTTPAGPPQFQFAPKKPTDVVAVTLSSSTPDAWYRYTLDGTAPTRTNGYIYCGVISLKPGMTLKAIAFQNGMADSSVSETAYPPSIP